MIAKEAAERLVKVRTALEELDAGGPGADPARYEAVAETLRELPTRSRCRASSSST